MLLFVVAEGFDGEEVGPQPLEHQQGHGQEDQQEGVAVEKHGRAVAGCGPLELEVDELAHLVEFAADAVEDGQGEERPWHGGPPVPPAARSAVHVREIPRAGRKTEKNACPLEKKNLRIPGILTPSNLCAARVSSLRRLIPLPITTAFPAW